MSSLYLPYVNIVLDTFALVVALIILATCINEFSTQRIGSRHFLIFQLSIVVALTADMIGWFGEGHPSLSLMTLAANTVMACACRIAIIGFMGYLVASLYSNSRAARCVLYIFRALCSTATKPE